MSARNEVKALLADAGIFTRMAGAAQLAAAIGRRQFSEEAYVMLSDVTAAANTLIGETNQLVTETYAVVFWVTAPNDPTGEQALDAVDAKRDAIIAALLGQEPDAAHSPLEYGGGSLGDFVSGAVLWEERFTTQSYVRKT